jgi:hypothetical protein
MHSVEGAVFPVAKSTLSFREIADYWSREIRPSASYNDLLNLLMSAWWSGELRGDSLHSRLELLKIMFTSMHRDNLEIIFIVGDDVRSPPVELPDGSCDVDIRPEIRVPSSNIESWDEAACGSAFHALAEVTETSSIDIYREFAVCLVSIKLTCEEFHTWLRSRGYSTPTFWRPRDRTHRHHASAASSAGSDEEAPHLRNAPQKAKKTWQAKPGERLTASQFAVLNTINALWPDGIMDHKAKARDDHILANPNYARGMRFM